MSYHMRRGRKLYRVAWPVALLLIATVGVVALLNRMQAMDNSATFAIVTGVLSGVVTTAVIVLGSMVFQTIIRPRYEELIYRGIILEGEWNVEGWDSAQVAKINLKQHAWDLSGTASFVAVDYTPEKRYERIRTFHVSGTINERLVELSFRHTDRARLGAGVWLFEVIGDGRQMRGMQVQYSVSTERGITHCNVVALRPGAPHPLAEVLKKEFSEESEDEDETNSLEDDITEDELKQIEAMVEERRAAMKAKAEKSEDKPAPPQ